MGRDKVIKKAMRALENLMDDEHVLIVIDYETGVARKYIDVNFDLQTIHGNLLHVGVFRGDRRLIAIIFDPYIEEFLCDVIGRYCDENERMLLKRGSLERVCKELQDFIKTRLSNIISNVMNVLIERYVK